MIWPNESERQTCISKQYVREGRGRAPRGGIGKRTPYIWNRCVHSTQLSPPSR